MSRNHGTTMTWRARAARALGAGAVAVGGLMVLALPSGAASANILTNGGFESGSFSPGWTTSSTGFGGWSVQQSGYHSCGGVVNNPVEGTHEAVYDMGDVSAGVMVSDPFTVPASGLVSLSFAYANFATSWSKDPTAPYDTTKANQWVSVDVIKAGASPTTTNPSDIVTTLFDSQSGTPALRQSWETLSASLAAEAGQSVQIRVGVADTFSCNPVWIDNVSVTSSVSAGNWGFESGSFAPGWSTTTDSGGGGAWNVDSSGVVTCNSDINNPVQGSYEAVFDMGGPSWGSLTSAPFTVPTAGQLSLSLAYDNGPKSWAQDPTNPFDLHAANQWLRVDVIKASASPVSLNPSDILATLFDSQAGSPPFAQSWTTLSATLTPFIGQSVELRVITANDEGCLPVWVDNIQVPGLTAPTSPTGLEVTQSGNSMVATWSPVSGATSYTCTLMYGFTTSTTFTVTTADPTCSFSGVGPQSAWGVSVVASAGGGSSPPVLAFLTPKPLTTTKKPVPTVGVTICQKGSSAVFKTLRGSHRTCPRGWHRV